MVPALYKPPKTFYTAHAWCSRNPAHTAAKQAITFNSTLHAAKKNSRLWYNASVSNEKEENVVNPPNTPTTKNNRAGWDGFSKYGAK